MKTWRYHIATLSSVVMAYAAQGENAPQMEMSMTQFYARDLPISSGYDQGLFFETTDQMNAMKINFLMQNRFCYNSRGGSPSDPPFHNTWNFENTRDALNLSGKLAKRGYYNFRVEFGAYDTVGLHDSSDPGLLLNAYDTNGPNVLWAFGGWSFDDHWNFAAGKMRLPVTREWAIYDEYQLMISPGYASTILDLEEPGIQFGYTADMWRLNAYFSTGINGTTFYKDHILRVNTTGQKYSKVCDSWVLGARFDWLAYCSAENDAFNAPKGQGPDASGRVITNNWTRFNQFTSPWGDPISVLVGGWFSYDRIHYVPALIYDAPTMLGHAYEITLDIQAGFGGGSLYALGWAAPSRAKILPDTVVQNANPWGCLVQASVYPTKTFELVARYEFAEWYKNQFISLARAPASQSSIINGGFNWYVSGQNFKVSADYSYSWKPITTSRLLPEAASTDWLIDPVGQKSQQIVRFQLQTLF